MYVMNTRRINKRIMELGTVMQINSTLGKAIAGPVSMQEIVFDQPARIEEFARKFQESMAQNAILYSDEEALIGAMIFGLLEETGLLEDLPPIVMDEMIRCSKVFRKGAFEDNPYFKNIRFEEKTCGRYRLTHESYAKYELFMYSTPYIDKLGIDIPRLAVYDHKFIFPRITEGNYTWMSVTPNEIYTMEEPIAQAKGKVLTLGCGMGYFAYMAALKDEVSSVTVIEKSRDVIELFTKFILPQFSVKEKIKIIEADAFAYMEALPDGEFDHCFADIWIGNTDTVPYLRMKRICSKFRSMAMSYWIEEALVETIMGYVFAEIMTAFYKEQNIKAPDMSRLPVDAQYKYEAIKNILKDVKITKPEQIDHYMDHRNIIRLLEQSQESK